MRWRRHRRGWGWRTRRTRRCRRCRWIVRRRRRTRRWLEIFAHTKAFATRVANVGASVKARSVRPAHKAAHWVDFLVATTVQIVRRVVIPNWQRNPERKSILRSVIATGVFPGQHVFAVQRSASIDLSVSITTGHVSLTGACNHHVNTRRRRWWRRWRRRRRRNSWNINSCDILRALLFRQPTSRIQGGCFGNS